MPWEIYAILGGWFVAYLVGFGWARVLSDSVDIGCDPSRLTVYELATLSGTDARELGIKKLLIEGVLLPGPGWGQDFWSWGNPPPRGGAAVEPFLVGGSARIEADEVERQLVEELRSGYSPQVAAGALRRVRAGLIGARLLRPEVPASGKWLLVGVLHHLINIRLILTMPMPDRPILESYEPDWLKVLIAVLGVFILLPGITIGAYVFPFGGRPTEFGRATLACWRDRFSHLRNDSDLDSLPLALALFGEQVLGSTRVDGIPGVERVREMVRIRDYWTSMHYSQ